MPFFKGNLGSEFLTMTLNTPWRLTAATIYKKPSESKILGSVDLDVTDLEQKISELRKKGVKVTLTHFITLVTAKAIAEEVPQFNTYLKRGAIHAYPEVVASVTLKLPNGELSSMKINSPEKLNIKEIVYSLQARIDEARKGVESNTNQMKGTLGKIPWPFRTWLYKLLKFLTLDLGLSFPFLSAQSFGTYVISNVGTLGLDGGYPALLPTGNLSLVLVLGRVREMPWVHEGNIVPRKILKLSAALDHRVVDAEHGGRLFNYLRKAIRHPEPYLNL
jgi:pyruvate/2-oxoglutarate dehydrogenase complex dihydrolipoamide acyltransferase (E2) component